jgi:hypothetical protein
MGKVVGVNAAGASLVQNLGPRLADQSFPVAGFLLGTGFEYNELSIQEIFSLCKKFFIQMCNEKR